MDNKVGQMICSGDVDHQENHGSCHEQYSELLEVPIEYLKAVQSMLVVESEEIKSVKGMEMLFVSESDLELDQEKLKAVKTLKAQQFNFLKKDDVFLLAFLWMATMKTPLEGNENFSHYFVSPIQSTEKSFYGEESDIPMLVDLAGTQLKNIKAYNRKILDSLEADDLDEVTLQELSNHFLSLDKGIRSVNMKIDILRYHLARRRRDLKDLVDRFAESVEDELQQYGEELEKTRFKVFQLVKKSKTDLFRLRFFPDSWKVTVVSLGMNTIILCARLMQCLGCQTDALVKEI